MKRIVTSLLCLASILNLLAQDQFYIEDFTIYSGETKTVSIMLDNEIEYTAIQADIMLPDGLSVAIEDGEYVFDLTDRKSRTHTISSNLLSSGAIRILIASQQKKVFNGNSGALVTFDVIADANLTGPKVITLSNVIASETNSTTHALPETTCSVTVVKLATSIALDKTNAEMIENEMLQLNATVLPDDATDKSVTWSSSDDQIATIDANGLVTAVAPGTATITATTNDGSNLTASCAVTVNAAVILATSITLDQTTAECFVGETLTLTPLVLPENTTDKSVTWSSSDDQIATVDANGLVAAVAPGMATITATTNDGSGLSATCGINIKQLVTSLTLDKESSELTVGETLQLAATVLPENATDKTVTWSSSNTVVATVDANALVTALAPGTATITATTNDGSDLTASCTLTVSPQTIVATSITLDMNEALLAVGNTLTINAIVLPEDATYKSVTWSSSNDQIATVDANGLVTAIAAGTATISASSVDGSNLSTACVITVIEPTVSSVLEINERAIRLQLSNTCQLVVTTEGAGSVTWASSNATIASVDANGVVTAHKNGIAIITATTSSGAEAWSAVYCYLRGDVDDTNKVDVTDVNTIVNIILGKE